MVDVIGTVLVGVTIAVIITAIATSLPIRRSARLALAGAAGAWVGFAGAVSGAGALSNPMTVLAMFGAALVATVALVLVMPAVRQALAAIPLPLLVGLNIVRLGSVLFVLLAFAERLSGPFHILRAGETSRPVRWPFRLSGWRLARRGSEIA